MVPWRSLVVGIVTSRKTVKSFRERQSSVPSTKERLIAFCSMARKSAAL